MGQVQPLEDEKLTRQIEVLRESEQKIVGELRKIIVAQDEAIEQVMFSIYVGGHCLLTGLPGLAKTLLISSIAHILGLKFKRIQFTPDLMPSDITGTEIITEDRTSGTRDLRFVKGPIFCNLLLADEINRTPPKTQAALLEAMEEKRVTVGGETFTLEPPFFVMATQNPIELEGTYPLPEAQLDRFMFNVIIGYLDEVSEIEVVNRTTGLAPGDLEQIFTSDQVIRCQQIVRQIPASEEVTEYAVRLVRATRPQDGSSPEFVSKWISYGASPRAAQYLILGGKARAILKGRYNVAVEDIQALAKPVLRHRLLSNFHAESEGVTTDDVIERLVKEVPTPKSGLK